MPDQDDRLQRFDLAQERFGSLVGQVGADGWGLLTPCDGWDARALVNHVTGEQLWATPMLAGRTIAEVGDQFDGDVLGVDPGATWGGAAAGSRTAFHETGALERTVHTSMGESPATQYLGEMTFDLIVHGWDLAQALGRERVWDAAELAFLEQMVAVFEPMSDDLQAAGVFGPSVTVDQDADQQTRLLAAFGRRVS